VYCGKIDVRRVDASLNVLEWIGLMERMNGWEGEKNESWNKFA
jgi:hypothetical protein